MIYGAKNLFCRFIMPICDLDGFAFGSVFARRLILFIVWFYRPSELGLVLLLACTIKEVSFDWWDFKFHIVILFSILCTVYFSSNLLYVFPNTRVVWHFINSFLIFMTVFTLWCLPFWALISQIVVRYSARLINHQHGICCPCVCGIKLRGSSVI